MKAITFKLAAISFAAMLLASCSDSNSNEGTNNPLPLVNSKIDGSDIGSSTDAQELASRVFNIRLLCQQPRQEHLTQIQ